jgi:copper chaperone
MTIQIQLENIRCEGCAGSIGRALLRDGRISSVEVDVPTGTAAIEVRDDMRSEICAYLKYPGCPEPGSVEGLASVSAKAKSFISCAVGRLDPVHECS